MPAPACSVENWKTVPSTADVLFSLHMPYKPPRNPLAAFIWRKRVWFETTFGIEGAEPWEKAILLMMYLIPFTLFMAFICTYLLPPLFMFLQRRAVHHLFGHEPYPLVPVQHVPTGRAASNVSGELWIHN